jgi:2,3-bisphosphoglycerate-independent phosphoglycerate mutase
LEAATQAVEVVDEVLGKLLEAVDAAAGVMVITADHGNADEMRVRNKKTKAWEPSTKHSLNPVPFLIYDPKYDGSYHLKPYSPEHNNNLSHVAATNFVLLGKAIPDDLAPSLFTI